MKKFLLTVCLSAVAFLSATHANQLTVLNLLSSPVYMGFNGVNPDGSYFSSPQIIYGANSTTVYTDPTQVPMMSGATTTGRFSLMLGWCPPDLTVSSPAFSGPGPMQSVPATSDCNSGGAFMITWTEGGVNNDVVLLLF